MSSERLDPVLLAHLEAVRRETPVITTLSNGKRNRIVSVDPEGVVIETDESLRKQTGPQRVPAWMLNVAWQHLRTTGSLTNRHLLAPGGLNVKRSSAVCALLARIPGVTVRSSRPIELKYSPTE